MDTAEPTELERIAARISSRDAANARDRERQAELVREMHTAGVTWDEIQRAAQVSRPTIARWIRR